MKPNGTGGGGDPRDEDLVRTYLAGERDAFTTLVERHRQRVYSVCLRVLGSAEDAADATQDTFIHVLRKLPQFRGDAAFTTWMHRIAVNACYDMLRTQRRAPMLHVIGDDDLPEPEAGPPEPDHAEEVAGTLDAAEALRHISDDYRLVLVLADIEDLPFEKIAQILDIPLGTVKSRAHRGRIALARAMGLTQPGEPQPPPEPSERQP